MDFFLKRGFVGNDILFTIASFVRTHTFNSFRLKPPNFRSFCICSVVTSVVEPPHVTSGATLDANSLAPADVLRSARRTSAETNVPGRSARTFSFGGVEGSGGEGSGVEGSGSSLPRPMLLWILAPLIFLL